MNKKKIITYGIYLLVFCGIILTASIAISLINTEEVDIINISFSIVFGFFIWLFYVMSKESGST